MTVPDTFRFFSSQELVCDQFNRRLSQRSLTLPLEIAAAELVGKLVAPKSIVGTLDVMKDY
jgi:hypothetical protein